jgi:hypothetical protein
MSKGEESLNTTTGLHLSSLGQRDGRNISFVAFLVCLSFVQAGKDVHGGRPTTLRKASGLTQG